MAPSWSKALPLFLVVLGSSPAALAQPQTDKRDVAPAGLAPTVPEFPNIQIASALPAPSPVPSALPDARPAAPVLAQSQSSPAPQGSTSPMGPPTTGGLVGGAPPMGQGGPMGGSQGKPADGKAPAAAAGGHAAPPGAAPRGPFLYEPSFSIAVGMAIIFFASFIVTTKQFFKYKAWFLFLLPQAVLMSVLGCVARTHVILNPKAKTAYIIQHLMFSIPLSLIGVLNMITFTRVVWLVTPNSLRNRKNIGLPIHHISFLWGIGWLTSDITKAVATNVGKPKGHEKPNPASMSNRIQTVCMLIMFVVIGCWTGWAAVFMRKSRHWPAPTDGVVPGVRTMGWASVTCGVLLTWRILFSTIEHDAMYNPKAFASSHEWVFWLGGVFPILAVYIIYNLFHPGAIYPMEFTRFKFDTKKMDRKLLEEGSWPPSISNPVPRENSPQDPKGFEVSMHEMQPHPGHKV